jgi:hypothetical protein
VDNNRRVLSAQEIEDRAADARALLGSKVFKDALADTEAEYVRQLIQADVGSLTAAAAHASMKVQRSNDAAKEITQCQILSIKPHRHSM